MKTNAFSSRNTGNPGCTQSVRILHAVVLLMIWTQLSFSQQAESSSADSSASSAARLSEILIKTPQPYDPVQIEEAHRKAEEIREAIRKGREFADLAKTYSQGPSAAQGGDVGYFSHGDLA
ncbi:MAG: peptidylprolyl isomerase, partial [Terriglobales bacterium]